MKYPPICFRFLGVLAAGLVLVMVSGCKKNEVAGAAVEKVVPAEQTSFKEVTSQLDPGGNFYLYLSTEQWLEGVSGKLSSWQQIFSAMPDLSGEDRTNINKGFEVLTKVIKDSGVEQISGVGMSSVAVEPDLYRSKAILHHYPGKGTGFLWDVFGRKPHALESLDFLPANTAMAMFSDTEVNLIWASIQSHVRDSGFTQAEAALEQLPASFQQMTGMKWEQVLASLGGEFGIVLTLDEARMIPVPMPGQRGLQVPEPGLMLFIKVNDEVIFNRLEQELKKAGSKIESSDQNGAKIRTMPVPLPLPVPLRPTLAAYGGYLIIASSDALVQEALAVKAGSKPGLKGSEEFKRLAKGIPTQGNQFCYLSQRFGKALGEIQQRALEMDQNTPTEMRKLLRSFTTGNATFTYSVGVHSDEGWMTVGNGNRSAGQVLAASTLIAPAGLLAAIAIPNFVRARETAQKNACINNLRMIDGAKQQWALVNQKPDTATPTEGDLATYLRLNRFPTCLAGGHYTVNAVNVPPRCSNPKHQSPD